MVHKHLQEQKKSRISGDQDENVISAEYMFLYIGRYKTLHISRQYKPQA